MPVETSPSVTGRPPASSEPGANPAGLGRSTLQGFVGADQQATPEVFRYGQLRTTTVLENALSLRKLATNASAGQYIVTAQLIVMRLHSCLILCS